MCHAPGALRHARSSDGTPLVQGKEFTSFANSEEVAVVLTERIFIGAVDADWQRAMDLGITAVPTHLCGGKRLTGFAAYDDFCAADREESVILFKRPIWPTFEVNTKTPNSLKK